MKHYKEFMDNQAMSQAGHARLMALGAKAQAKKPTPWKRWGALAACAALVLGVGAFALGQPGRLMEPLPTVPIATPDGEGGNENFWSQNPGGVTTQPVLDDTDVGDHAGFVAVGPGEETKLMFPMISWVDFADVTGKSEVSASLALPDGAFSVPLTKEDIQTLFWGPEGKPAADNPKTDPGDFPIMLMNWAGYAITGGATYDGNGDLWELWVRGEKGEDSFTLRAAPGHIPPTCLVESGAAVTDVSGVEVKGWYRSYDNDGDGVVEHICTSEFLAGGVGFRFENIGSGGMKAGEDEADDLGGAMAFNQMVVTQLCHKDGFCLDPFAHNDKIPSWAEENYNTISQAIVGAEVFAFGHPEADFLSYLPTEGPAGYGEFHARLSYQEGVRKDFFVRWTRGYDDVEVEVCLPEGEAPVPPAVDINVPESYDWRLYDGAICDVVPEEYQADFYKPAFLAEDMSLEIVQARMRDKDTGGQSCNFWVLHDNGAAVGYSCSGVSAEYVWSLILATLEK